MGISQLQSSMGRIASTCARAITLLGLATGLSAAGYRLSGPHAANSPEPPDFRLWVTTPDLTKHLAEEQNFQVEGEGASLVQVNTSQELQTIEGFGAAFTDTSAWLLHALPQQRRVVLMKSLFDRREGIHLSLMRVPMGSSDFTRTSTYSYADTVQDQALPEFSIRHDNAYILPVLREAQKMNPEMRLFANPWSPPAWMKTNQSMLGSGKRATLLENQYGALANYFVKFLLAYEKKSVHIWGISAQNEPNQDPATYSAMYLAPEDEARFLVENLAPALHKANLNPVILAADTSSADPAYAKALFHDPRVLPLVGATAWHCYQDIDTFAAGLAELRTILPDRPMYVTECSTGPGGYIAGDTTEKTLVALKNGASGMVLWNLALDPSGGPKMGVGCERCTGLVTIDPASGHYEMTLNYYELGHFSKFVHMGARRLKTSDGDGIWAQAFRNPEGSIAIVLYNTNTDTRTVSVQLDSSKSVRFALSSHATATLVKTSNEP
ncbi:MAG: glycoside hydrolase family 30 protein [Acidobacteriaceae bacterium]|nr:glycoside hydrolase family 30 protein [Acidobacteriaceae bacterium]